MWRFSACFERLASRIEKTDHDEQQFESSQLKGWLTHIPGSSKVRLEADVAGMNPLASNANRVGLEVRLRLLALSVAILGLVLAPLGFSG